MLTWEVHKSTTSLPSTLPGTLITTPFLDIKNQIISESKMRSLFAVLALLPVAFGCLDPGTNSCASFIKSQSATASAFCATFTKSVVTATSGLPSWATNCSQKPSLISKECSCYYTDTGTGGTKTSAGSGGTAPTGVTTTLPASSGVVTSAAPITVTGSFDGGMKRYDRSSEFMGNIFYR